MNGKTNVAFPYGENYIAIKRKCSVDTWYDVDKPLKHSMKRQKPGTEDPVFI